MWWEADEAAVVRAELAERGRRLLERVAATRVALAAEAAGLPAGHDRTPG